MNYAHLEINTNKLLGWYNDEIHAAIPLNSIEVTDEKWKKALFVNANFLDNNGEFIYKDFSNLEEKINLALFKLKGNINYEAPTLCLDIPWVGGYGSAQMLNAKRTLCLEMGLDFCAFTDSEDVDHILTLSQAKEVCIAVAAEFEARRSIYKMKKRTIELCTTIEELEAIEI